MIASRGRVGKTTGGSLASLGRLLGRLFGEAVPGLRSAAGQYDLIIEAGATWSKTLKITRADGTPKDLDGYRAELQIRKYITGSIVKALSVGNGITITAAEGKIVLSLTDTETSALHIRRGVYDLLMIGPSPNCERSRLIEGSVKVVQAVTR